MLKVSHVACAREVPAQDQLFWFQSSFFQTLSWKVADDGSIIWFPATCMGDQDGVPGSWHQPGPALTSAVIRGVTQQTDAQSPSTNPLTSTLSLCLSKKSLKLGEYITFRYALLLHLYFRNTFQNIKLGKPGLFGNAIWLNNAVCFIKVTFPFVKSNQPHTDQSGVSRVRRLLKSRPLCFVDRNS